MQAVADGVFYAELNELLMRELGGEGYSGVEVRSQRGSSQVPVGWRQHGAARRGAPRQCARGPAGCWLAACPLLVHDPWLSALLPPAPQVRVTPMRTEVIIRATRTQNVLGELRPWVPRQAGHHSCCVAGRPSRRQAAVCAAAALQPHRRRLRVLRCGARRGADLPARPPPPLPQA